MGKGIPEYQAVKRAAFPLLLIVAPAVLFYGILFRHLANIPLLDDYDALLGFLDQMARAVGMGPELRVFLAAQHNEYKLFWGNGLAWAQFKLLGHVNFAQLCVIGDSAVLVLALELWWMFLPGEKDLAKRLAYFVPVAWLLFQLEYFETLNWAMASLQNLWVLVFAIGAIQCLLRPSRKAYTGALVLLVLAGSASGNGLLLVPLGLLMLAVRRHWARAGGWLVVSGACVAAYAYHYDTMSSQSPVSGSVFSTLLHWRPDYVIAFIGNVGAIGGIAHSQVNVCLALGVLLLAVLGWVIVRGYARRNPAVCCTALLLLATAMGVAGMRSDFGLAQSLSSRYAIYGALFAILTWTAVTEEFLQHRAEPLLENNSYLAMAGAAIIFGLAMDLVGYHNLAQREQYASRGLAAFERTASSPAPEGPVLPVPAESADLHSLRERARSILEESLRLGVYQPFNN
jgi:hypothetical protein